MSDHSLGDLIVYLWDKYTEEHGVIYLLIFISVIEPEKEIMEYTQNPKLVSHIYLVIIFNLYEQYGGGSWA